MAKTLPNSLFKIRKALSHQTFSAAKAEIGCLDKMSEPLYFSIGEFNFSRKIHCSRARDPIKHSFLQMAFKSGRQTNSKILAAIFFPLALSVIVSLFRQVPFAKYFAQKLPI